MQIREFGESDWSQVWRMVREVAHYAVSHWAKRGGYAGMQFKPWWNRIVPHVRSEA